MKKISLALVVLIGGLMLPAIGAEASVLLDGVTSYAHSNFDADVHWEVYSPYDGSGFGLGSISDFAYYYQLENTGTGSDNALTQLGVDNPYGLSITGAGYLTGYNLDSLSGSVAPSLTTYGTGGSSAVWTFTGIGQGSSSYLLYYTTPWPPTMVTGGVQAGAFNKEGSVPGPAPEPVSTLLFGLGLAGLAAGTVRKRFIA